MVVGESTIYFVAILLFSLLFVNCGIFKYKKYMEIKENAQAFGLDISRHGYVTIRMVRLSVVSPDGPVSSALFVRC